jgi:peptidoglycan/LPS O-acetylase OafA/YrhL
MVATKPKAFYIPSIDGIRACAFLLVFIFHSFPTTPFIPGMFGVTVFFFLSGYLITTLLQLEVRKTGAFSLRDFYIRRTLRILPPLYLVYAIAFNLGKAGVLSAAGNAEGFLSTFFYFYNYASILSTNYRVPTGLALLWSIMVEEHFYLFFPFIFYFFVSRKVKPSTQASVLFWLCMGALAWRVIVIYGFHTIQNGYMFWGYHATDCRFDSILWGCLLAVHNNPQAETGPKWYAKYVNLFALAGCALLVVDVLVRDEPFRQSFKQSLDCLALYPIFYFCIRRPDFWMVRPLQWKPLRYLGWISFTMYLSHECILIYLQEHYPSHPVLDSAICFGASLLFSWSMREAVEQPLHRLRNRFRGKMAPSSVASEGFPASS